MEYLSLGVVIGSFALDGSFKILSSTDFSEDRYKKGQKIYLRKDDDIIEVTVNKYRHSGELDIVTFNEINTVEEALAKKGYEVLIDKEEAKLPKNYYHFYELETCDVYADDKLIGHVKKVEEYPAQVTLRVNGTNGKEFQVPFVDAFISKVDIKNKRIDINLIEGML